MDNDYIELSGIKVNVADMPTDEEILQEYLPDMWIDEEKKIINENTFAKAFREINHLQYSNGLFYTRSGRMTEEIIARDVWASLEDIGIARDVEKTVRKLVGAIRLASTVDKLELSEDVIPFSNGDFIVSKWDFHMFEFSPVPYRLAAPLMLGIKDAPYFFKWLHDLFEEEDIPVIQEFLGYCMVYSTKAQKALFLVGDAEVGKSGIGKILEAVIGEAFLSIPSTQDFLQDKFKLPELEHRLVMYDDDLDSGALDETGLYKKLITNDIAITADRKYGQPFKFKPKVKLIASCNQMLTSSNDLTPGFYRRLLPILVKPRRKDFVPDLNFYDKLVLEAPGIAQWSLLGLRRLRDREWKLVPSKRTEDYLAQKQSIGNPLPDFMDAVFDFNPTYPGLPTTEIMRVYEYWCRKNNCTPEKPRVVQTWLSDNAQRYKIIPSQNIKSGDKRVRGYTGLAVKGVWSLTGKIQLV